MIKLEKTFITALLINAIVPVLIRNLSVFQLGKEIISWGFDLLLNKKFNKKIILPIFPFYFYHCLFSV